MNEVHFTGEPKIGKRRGWPLFVVVNVLLLGGCLWVVGTYNDWGGDDHLRSGEVITASDRVLSRIVVCLILVGLFGMTFCHLHRWISWARWIIGPLLVLGLVAGLFSGTSYMFGVSAMLAVAFLIAFCAAVNLPAVRRWTFALAMTAITSGTLLASHVSLPRHQRLMEARNAYPFEDISSRLDYEPDVVFDSPPSLANVNAEPKPPGASESLASINSTEAIYRRRWLKKFHDENYEKFIRAEGFGVKRMSYASTRYVDLPSLRNVSIDEQLVFPASLEESGLYISSTIDPDRIEFDGGDPIESFHRRSLDDFLNPITFGFVRSRQVVAGFQPHAFHLPVTPKYRPSKQPKLTELQLVSLLRFREPLVYEVDNLPRMDQLSSDDIETRALDSFEHFALMRMQNGEEIVVDSSGPTIRMLGAIRARYECLQCHTAEDGSLLGAFSYRFSSPAPEKTGGNR